MWLFSVSISTKFSNINVRAESIAVVYVVVQFGFWFNFDFPLFFSMLIYDNEYQTKENQNWTKNQIELQHLQTCLF